MKRRFPNRASANRLSISMVVGAILIMAALVAALAWEPLNELGNLWSQEGYASEREQAATGGNEQNDSHKAASIWPSFSAGHQDSWQLQLVNANNRISNEYEPPLVQLAGGQAVDERCYEELQAMLDDCRNTGLQPVICSSYRSIDIQKQILDIGIAENISRGMNYSEAESDALKTVQKPGYSEHHLGLAVDIVDNEYQLLDEAQAERTTQQWLMTNSWKYGFILRYPSDKEALTSISYEPWHYRYVGKQAASDIYERQICLEEYLG